MTAQPEAPKMPWWEDRGARDSVTKSNQEVLDFLLEWIKAEPLAAAMEVPLTHISYWHVHPDSLDHREETRLRFIYRVVRTMFYYSGCRENLIFDPVVEGESIYGLLCQGVPDHEVLRQMHVRLAKFWRKPPAEPPEEE